MIKSIALGITRNWSIVVAFVVVGSLCFAGGYWVGHPSTLRGTKVSAGQLPASPQPTSVHETDLNAPVNASAVHTSVIPSDASPELKEFLQDKDTLNQKMAQFHSGGSPSPEALAQFRQQNADLLNRMHQLAQVVSQQQAQKPIPEPPPLTIPANASLKLQAYLKERDQLMRDQIAFINQHRTDAPAARQVAMQQWRTQNLPRFKKLQQEGQTMAQSTQPAAPAAK